MVTGLELQQLERSVSTPLAGKHELLVENSSAISALSIDFDSSEVSVNFTSDPNKTYVYETNNPHAFKFLFEEIKSKNGSIGSFISNSISQGIIYPILP